MAERPKRRRVVESDPSAPATAGDRIRWKGFCEIESDPAFFNVMLRDFGVKDVRVQEVVSLDPEMLSFLHRPIYGLIFLFRWREEDADKQEPSCPEGIWFANQTVNNACASVALLNIVNNVPDLDLGDHLEQFKHFTADFTPALRGDAIGNFEFVKTIHNSFARKMDMLNADLQLKNDASSRKKPKAKSSDEDDAGFHFIAFVPIQGKVWKLDGLERQPQSLESIKGDDWVRQVAPEIESRMAQYEEGQIEFAIMSLVREPLADLVTALAENVMSINVLSQRLGQVKPGWEDFLSERTGDGKAAGDETIIGPCEHYQLYAETIDQAEPSPVLQTRLKSDRVTELLTAREELVTAQAGLRASIRDETKAFRTDNERAASRRNDKAGAHTEDSAQLPLQMVEAQNLLQESTITELWMRLAAGYMAHSYAEQVLLLHETRSGLLEDTFHWSFDPSRAIEEGSDEWMINEMFDATDDILNLWEDIKNEHMRALRPPAGTSLTAHLEAIVSGGLSTSSFKEKVSEFLSGLLSAHPAPLLTQLESGKIDGLSPRSTAALKRRAGFV
ncbi:MAG: hypothetical protein LQ343_002061 [Gyalolechia ehrenbergii]|nr:MAG: hypothetical protein LQ343_002061 [Gyalolechia ehrenbergii]